jgi:hypothetical protein
MRDEGPVRLDISLDLVPLRRELANVFIDSRKLLGVQNKLHSNEVDFFIGWDVIGI